jgi:spoIIIJ-associated protein
MMDTVSDENVTLEPNSADDAPPPPAPEDDPIASAIEVAPPDVAAAAAAPAVRPEPEDKHAPFDEDGRADDALDFVVAVLTKMGLDCTVDLMENEPEDPPTDIRIEVTGNDATRLIGKKGQTLAAMQFLTNRAINRPTKRRRHTLIDADGYRMRRESALSSMAQRLGKQAVEEGKIITFEPMSAQDRRVVHLALAKFPGVVTKSEGKGATRRVQIIPVRDDE